jgi:Tol biopolymer transport system component
MLGCTRLFLGIAFAATAACGSQSPVGQTSRGVDTTHATTPATERAAEAVRTAPVPEAPSDEVIVFTRAGGVWRMRPDGEEASQLTVRQHGSADATPRLSPDGTALVWSGPDPSGRRCLFLMRLAELVPMQLTAGDPGTEDIDPAWSRDATHIAFLRGEDDERRDLYVLEVPPPDGARSASGRPLATLALAGDDDHPELVGGASWGPGRDDDQITIAADRRDGDGTLLYVVDVTTNRARPLTPALQGAWFLRDRDPSWSPDGPQLAFASNRHAASNDGAEDFDIYVMNADGSGLTRVTDDPGVAVAPAWSPDGTRLYFESTRDRVNDYESEIYVMASGGGEQRRLTRDERPQNRAPWAGRSK